MKQNTPIHDVDIDLIELLRTIWKEKLKIILIVIFFTSISVGYHLKQPKLYNVSMTVKEVQYKDSVNFFLISEYVDEFNDVTQLKKRDSLVAYLDKIKALDRFISELMDYEELTFILRKNETIKKKISQLSKEDQQKMLYNYAKSFTIEKKLDEYNLNLVWHDAAEAITILDELLEIIKINLKKDLINDLKDLQEITKYHIMNRDLIELETLKEQYKISREDDNFTKDSLNDLKNILEKQNAEEKRIAEQKKIAKKQKIDNEKRIKEEKRLKDEEEKKKKYRLLVNKYGESCKSHIFASPEFNNCLKKTETEDLLQAKLQKEFLESLTPEERRAYACKETFGFIKGSSNFKDCIFKLYATELELEKLNLEKQLALAQVGAENLKEQIRVSKLYNIKKFKNFQAKIDIIENRKYIYLDKFAERIDMFNNMDIDWIEYNILLAKKELVNTSLKEVIIISLVISLITAILFVLIFNEFRSKKTLENKI
jgi:LPS O-antigen subunit length determinant protein (WzzB/FepE family)